MLKSAVSHSEKDQLEINTAYRIKEQNIFQLNMKLQKWERLDLSDSFTRNLIIEINADESKMQKFNEDVLRNQFDPRIKFLPMADASNQRFTQPTHTPVVFGKSPEEASGGRSFSQLQIIPPPIPSDIPAQENNYTKKSKDCPVFSLSNHIPLETCQIPPQQNRAMPPQNHQVAAPSNFMRSKNCLMPNPQNCLIPQQNCQMPPTYNWPMPPPPSRAALQNSPVQSQNNQMVPPNSSWTSQNIQIPPGNVSMPSKIPQLAPFNVNASETPFLMQNQNFPMPFQQNSMSSPFNPRVFPNSELPPNSPMTSGNLSVVPPRNPTVPHQNLPITFQTSHMEPRNISMVFQNNHPKARNVPMMPQNKIVEPSPMAPFHFKGPPPNIQAPQGFPPILCQTFQGPPPSIQGPGGYSTIPPPNIQSSEGYWPTPPRTVQGPPSIIQAPLGLLPIPSQNVQGTPHNSHGPPPYPPSNWPTRPQNFQEQSRSIQIPPGFEPNRKFNGTPQNYQSAPTKCQIQPPCPLSIQNTQRGVYGKSATITNMMIRQNSRKGYRNNGKRSGPPKNQNHGNGNEPQSMRRSIPVVKVLAPHSKPNVDDIMKIDTPSTTSSNDTVPDCNHGDVTANLMDTQKARNLNQQEIHKNEQDFLTDPIPEVPVDEPSVCERHDAKTESASIPLEVVSTQSKNKTDRNPDNLAQLPITTEVYFLVDTTVEITDSEHEPKSILTPEADEPTLPRKETVKDDVATSIVPVTLSESDVFQNSPRLCKNLHAKPTAADRGVMGKKEHAKPDTSKCKGKKNRNGHKAPPSPKPSMTSRYAISGSPTKPNISSQVEKKPENVEHKKVITAIIINAPALKIESNKQNDVNGSETLKTKPEDEPSCSLQPEENNGKKKNKKAKKTKSGKETNVEEDFDELLKRFQLEDEKNKISDGDTKTKSAPKTTKRRTIKQYRQEKAEAEAEAAKAAEKAASPIEPAIQTLEDLYEFENFDEEYCVVTDIQNIHYPTDLPAIPEEVVTRVQKQIEEFVADVKECIREGNRLPYWPDLEFKLEDSLDLEKVNQDVLDFFSSKFSDLRRSDTPWAQFRRLFYSELVKAFVPQIWPVFAVLLNMSHKFVACDAARERQNRAYAFASQQVFQHALVHNAWATLDIEDEMTYEYINCMKISELERKKFEADVLTNSVDPTIKFVKTDENLLPLVVSQRAPRGRGTFNQRYQQRNNNWTRRNFAQNQRFQQQEHSNYPMQQYFIGSSQTVPLMALQIPSCPSGYAPVQHGSYNTFSAAHGYSRKNQLSDGHFPSPTESGDSDVYTSSSTNGSVAEQNIQQVQTIIGFELAEDKNEQIILQHHEELQSVAEVKNGKKDVVSLPNGADDISGTSKKDAYLSCDLSNQGTSDEVTMKTSNSKSVLPTAPQSAKFVEIAELPPSIKTPSETDIQTTAELELKKESPIVPDGATKIDTGLNCEMSKLDKPSQSMETTDFDNKEFKEQDTSDEATAAVSKPTISEFLLSPALESIVAEDMSGASNMGDLSKPVLSTSITPTDTETEELKGKTTDEGATEATNSEFMIPQAYKSTEGLEFPERVVSVSAGFSSKDAEMPVVENQKPSKPLMSEILLAAIEKEKGTVNSCLKAAPIVLRNICQTENKNVTDTDGMAKKSDSKAASSSQFRKSGDRFHNKKPEAPKNHLPAQQEKDSNSGWKTVKGSSKDSNNSKKLAVSAEQPPIAKDGKKRLSTSVKRSSGTVPAISPTQRTEESENNTQEGSSIDKPDHPEKLPMPVSNQKNPVKKQKKDKKAKTAKTSDIDDFDALLKQFKEEDRKSAEESGKVCEAVFETAKGNKKKRTIRQYQSERVEAKKKEQEIFDSIEKDGKRLEVCVNMGLCQFFEELNHCVITRSPMYNWPECPMRDLSENEEITRERDELVFNFIQSRILDQFERFGTTPILRELFYRFLGRHYNSNLGLILEPLAKVLKDRDITFEDEKELFGRMLNKRECRAEWNVFNFHYPDASNE
ncbi:hypothetical protein L5515_018969 [Caenorhabditis briggsae]|uniref:Uncharacterized protein n=1 Tax=Caenorhabditis briggsae TaxID=6238 RepID=A0AAE9FDL3_CAEBR|nr:hypothetical protein L5515_018969 [Caenorhabditis briggsae]